MTRAWSGPGTDSLSRFLSGVPSFPGKWRLVDTIGRFTSRIGGSRSRFSPFPGTQLEVDLRDRIERQMWGGCYETHVRKCFEALLRSGDVFLDIGAHIGYHTVLGAWLVGATGRVFAFEPDTVLYGRLVQNAAQFPWVRAFPCAVWATTGMLAFERSSESSESGWGTLTAVRDLRKGHHVAVEAVSLDNWCQRFPVDRVRAIKIDAEGSEPRILEGAENLIRQFGPVIVLEANEVLLRQAGSSAAALAGRLFGLGYWLYGLSWPRLERVVDARKIEAAEVLCIPAKKVEATLESLNRAGFES